MRTTFGIMGIVVASLSAAIGVCCSFAQETTGVQEATEGVMSTPKYFLIAVSLPHEKVLTSQIVAVSEQGAEEDVLTAVATQHGFAVKKDKGAVYIFSPCVIYNHGAAQSYEVFSCLLSKERTTQCEEIIKQWGLAELRRLKESLHREEAVCGDINLWFFESNPQFAFKAYVRATLEVEGLNRDLINYPFKVSLAASQIREIHNRLADEEKQRHLKHAEAILYLLSSSNPTREVMIQYNSLITPETYPKFGQEAMRILDSIYADAQERFEQLTDLLTSTLAPAYGVVSGVQPYEHLPPQFQEALRRDYEDPLTEIILRELGDKKPPVEALSRSRVNIKFVPAVGFSVKCADRVIQIDVMASSGTDRKVYIMHQLDSRNEE